MDIETLKGLEHLIETSNDLTDINLAIAILNNNYKEIVYKDNRAEINMLDLLMKAINKRRRLQNQGKFDWRE